MTCVVGFGNLLDCLFFSHFLDTVMTVGRFYSGFLCTEDFQEYKIFVDFCHNPPSGKKIGCFNSFCAVTGRIIIFIQWSLPI